MVSSSIGLSCVCSSSMGLSWIGSSSMGSRSMGVGARDTLESVETNDKLS